MLVRLDGSTAIPTDFPHQFELVSRTNHEPGFAIFWEMGVAKSRPAARSIVEHRHTRDIDGVIVLAPGGVHRNWITDELPKHCPIPWVGMDWHSKRSKIKEQLREEEAVLNPKRGELPWVTMTYEGACTAAGLNFLRRFVGKFPRYAVIVDEGSRIKTPSADRTQTTLKICHGARFVRVLNGTPVANAPTDVYTQMLALDPLYWVKRGIGSWAAFCSRFVVTKEITIAAERDLSMGAESTLPALSPDTQLDLMRMTNVAGSDDEIVGYVGGNHGPVTVNPHVAALPTGRKIKVVSHYRELDKLKTLIEPLSHRLTKKEAGLNLPPKLYQQLQFDLVPEQRAAYDKLKKDFMLEVQGKLVTATLAMTRILRLQQIACGYIGNPDNPEAEPLPIVPENKEPRLGMLMDTIPDVPGQAIIWARFTLDVDRIMRVLHKDAVRYDGKVSNRDRDWNIDAFRRGDKRWFVAKASSIGMGVTLVNATTTIYYSNTFSLVERLQSEDRNHRAGQHNPVTYLDLVAARTVDTKIRKALLEKKSISDEITGDEYRRWLE